MCERLDIITASDQDLSACLAAPCIAKASCNAVASSMRQLQATLSVLERLRSDAKGLLQHFGDENEDWEEGDDLISSHSERLQDETAVMDTELYLGAKPAPPPPPWPSGLDPAIWPAPEAWSLSSQVRSENPLRSESAGWTQAREHVLDSTRHPSEPVPGLKRHAEISKD